MQATTGLCNVARTFVYRENKKMLNDSILPKLHETIDRRGVCAIELIDENE